MFHLTYGIMEKQTTLTGVIEQRKGQPYEIIAGLILPA